MVSNKFLGALSVRLGFHKHLRFNGSLVQSQIRDYVTEIGAAEEEANGAVDYWVHVKSPPKVSTNKSVSLSKQFFHLNLVFSPSSTPFLPFLPCWVAHVLLRGPYNRENSAFQISLRHTSLPSLWILSTTMARWSASSTCTSSGISRT
jgi:hypothetical protein